MKKLSYKLFLLMAKWIPVVMAAGILVNITLALLEVESIILDILAITFGNSISYVIFMYITSCIFQFCKWHKLTILYNAIILAFNITISYIESYNLYVTLIILYSITIIFTGLIYYYYKNCNHESLYNSSESSIS